MGDVHRKVCDRCSLDVPASSKLQDNRMPPEWIHVTISESEAALRWNFFYGAARTSFDFCSWECLVGHGTDQARSLLDHDSLQPHDDGRRLTG